ncbi:MAG: M23 family metallopeptidase [Acidobacteria bacterium]|nr:M23 family metallopeptidase [Acidobacteriota bacterium]
MRRHVLVPVLLVALLAAAVAPAPAAARTSRSSARARRDAIRSKKAALARQLNALRASERQLLAAAAVLGDQADVAAARVAAARQAAAVAQAELADASDSLRTTRAHIEQLSGLLVARAVQRFMAPRVTGMAALADTADLAVTARKQALLDSVSANDRDLIDQLRLAREDYELARQAAAAATARARERTRQTEATLAALRQATDAKRRVAAGVEARRRDVLGEIEAQAAAESALTAIINARTHFGPDTIASSRGCIWPARGRVTSEFGRRWGRLHAGIDVAAPVGTPIWAAKAGTVIFTGQQRGYGNVVIIDHGGGLTTLYGHQSRIKSYEGERVRQGQTIGAVGSTGHSTGPHVHFETRYNGRPRNPRTCLR